MTTLVQASYIGIFISLFFSGIIIPVPEELQLLGIGYLSKAAYLNIWVAGIIAFAAAFLSDIALYLLAKKDYQITKKIRYTIEHSKLASKYLRPDSESKWTNTLRYVLGIRVFGNGIAVLAGIMKVDQRKFFLLDMIVLLIYVPGIIVLGVYAHNILLKFIDVFGIFRHWIFIFLLIIGSAITIKYLYKQISQKSPV